MDTAIVVGAGPAGLAAAAPLRRAGGPAGGVEQGGTPPPPRRARDERPRRDSPRWFSTLPDGPSFRAGTFPTRDELVAYLDAYAAHHALDVRFGTKVERLERAGDRWVVQTSGGELRARHVIVAGGYEHRPFVPAWAGRARFRGAVSHAAGYRNAEPYRGRTCWSSGRGAAVPRSPTTWSRAAPSASAWR